MNLLKRYFLKNSIRIFSLFLFIVFMVVFTGCAKSELQEIIPSNYAEESHIYETLDKEKASINKEEKNKSEAIYDNQYQDSILAEEELLKYKANELGSVMILMYHQIGDTEAEWMRTPQNFKRDLLKLYENDYRLISLLDYINGNMDIDAGKSPVVITFDDATRSQFNYIETNEGVKLDPDCAVAILEDFCSKHPDFGNAATFYIYYPNPFRQEQYINTKLEFLIRNGYEIGNHTYDHVDLSKISDSDVIMELALHSGKTSEILPGYKVRSLALPYGQYPKDKDLLVQGSYIDYSYINEAVLLVGSNPAPSPFSSDFDYLSIPRIRASETMVENMGIYDWLDYLKKYPDRRYFSDGNINTITAPQELSQKFDKESAKARKVCFY